MDETVCAAYSQPLAVQHHDPKRKPKKSVRDYNTSGLADRYSINEQHHWVGGEIFKHNAIVKERSSLKLPWLIILT